MIGYKPWPQVEIALLPNEKGGPARKASAGYKQINTVRDTGTVVQGHYRTMNRSLMRRAFSLKFCGLRVCWKW